MDKVIKDGKVAILISKGFGAGWYTWNSEYPECLYHPKVVEMVEQDRRDEITNEFMQELLGVDYFYAGGADSLDIIWLDEGSSFRVDEYDGSESLQTEPDLTFRA